MEKKLLVLYVRDNELTPEGLSEIKKTTQDALPNYDILVCKSTKYKTDLNFEIIT